VIERTLSADPPIADAGQIGTRVVENAEEIMLGYSLEQEKRREDDDNGTYRPPQQEHVTLRSHQHSDREVGGEDVV
jgi:hypothetical protein